jgi:hypothetical protein
MAVTEMAETSPMKPIYAERNLFEFEFKPGNETVLPKLQPRKQLLELPILVRLLM